MLHYKLATFLKSILVERGSFSELIIVIDIFVNSSLEFEVLITGIRAEKVLMRTTDIYTQTNIIYENRRQSS